MSKQNENFNFYTIRQRGVNKDLCKPERFGEISECMRRLENEGFKNVFIYAIPKTEDVENETKEPTEESAKE